MERSAGRGLTYVLGTGVAVFRVQRLEAVTTVGPPLLHDVALAAQHRLALEAAEVFHVPVPALGFGTLVCEDDLRMGSHTRSVISGQGLATRTHGATGAPEPEGQEGGARPPTGPHVPVHVHSTPKSAPTFGFA